MALTGRGRDVLKSYSYRNKNLGKNTTILFNRRLTFFDDDLTEEAVWRDWFFGDSANIEEDAFAGHSETVSISTPHTELATAIDDTDSVYIAGSINGSVTESATATSTESALGQFGATLSESVSATHSELVALSTSHTESATANHSSSVVVSTTHQESGSAVESTTVSVSTSHSEVATATDLSTTSATLNVSVSESASAIDSSNSSVSIVFTESTTATESQSSFVVTSSASAESALAAESQAASYTTSSSVSESVSSSELSDRSLTTLSSVSESVSPSESTSSSYSTSSLIDEHTDPSDTIVGGAVLLSSSEESALAIDSQDRGVVVSASISESAIAKHFNVGAKAGKFKFQSFATHLLAKEGYVYGSSLVSSVLEGSHNMTFVTEKFVTVSESTDALDASSSGVNSPSSIIESSTLSDNSSALLFRSGSVSESVNASTSDSVILTAVASKTESASAIDDVDGFSDSPYEVYATYTLGVSGASWSIVFDNNNGITKSYTVGFGSGETVHRMMAHYNSTANITLNKLNNGGLAQDTVLLFVYVNGSLVDSATYSVSDDVSPVVFNLTGLSIGDVIHLSLGEG